MKNNMANPKRVPELKSLPCGCDAPGFLFPNPPEIRMPVKSAVHSATRQFPKSPQASLFKKNQIKGNEVNQLLLVTINVLGSSGPMRFLAHYGDPVYKVIETALKSYARGGRLPVLGQNAKQLELHCAHSGCGQALDPLERIGDLGTRNFLLCKKHDEGNLEQELEGKATTHAAGDTNIWLNTKCLGVAVSSHSAAHLYIKCVVNTYW